MTLDRTKGRNPNLGFGMVPPKPPRQERYNIAARHVLDLLNGAETDEHSLDAASEVKGLCNRILREDQPDWVVVWLRMGLPSLRRLSWMANDLPNLRQAIKDDDRGKQSWVAERLQRAGLATALEYFLGGDEPPEEPGMGYLYVLSTRTERGLLKIGQTRRDVLKRVEEINRATGVVEPFSPRRVWRVRDPIETEKQVHALLNAHRVRKDREFFRISLPEASSRIEHHLRSVDGKVRSRGTIKHFFEDRGYGFIRSDGLDYFFHASELRMSDSSGLNDGLAVSFDRLDTSFGPAAADVQPISD